MPTDIPPLIHGNFYHIYNRGINRQNIFLQSRNYAYFLNLWWKHINPIAEMWAYGLLKNHFHAAVYIRNMEDLSGFSQTAAEAGSDVNHVLTPSESSGNLTGLKSPHQYFSNFFNAYTRGVNIASQRTGALFERPFKRIPIGSASYLMRLIVYIHQNPQKHHFCEDFREWNYSSYHELTSDAPTRLERDKIIGLFGSREDFVRIHQEIQPLDGLEDEE